MNARAFVGNVVVLGLGTVAMLAEGPRLLRWDNLGPGGGGAFYEAAWHPRDPDVVLAGSDVSGVYRSTDGALRWEVSTAIDAAQGWPEQSGLYTVERLVYAPSAPEVVFAACWRGIYRSTDGGVTWASVIAAEFPTYYGAVAVDPADANIVLAASGGRYQYTPYASALTEQTPYVAPPGHYWRSTDGGKTFTKLANTGLPENFAATDLWIDPGSPASGRLVILASFDGIFRSTDGGLTFTPANQGLPHLYVRDLDGGVFPDGRSAVYVALQLSGAAGVWDSAVYKSTDGGRTWTNAGIDIPTFDSDLNDGFWDWCVAVHPTNPDIAYVLIGNADSAKAGVYKTVNGGASWAHLTGDWKQAGFTEGYVGALTGQPGHQGNFIALSAADPSRVIFGNLYELYRTTDGGATWQECYSQKVSADAADRRYSGRGAESTFVYSIVFDPADANQMWIGLEDVFCWKTLDRGKTLSHVKPEVAMEIRTREADACWQLVADPARPGAWYGSFASPSSGISLRAGGVFYSSDGGETWQNLSGDLPLGRPEIVLARSSAGQAQPAIYAAVAGQGIYRTTDHGTNWVEISNGFRGGEKTNLWRLAIDDRDANRLWVGLRTDAATEETTGGMYRTIDGGATWTKLTQFPGREVFALHFRGGALYAGAATDISDTTVGGVYVSSDGGESWRRLFDQPFVHAMAFDPANANVIYAASSIPPNLSRPPNLDPGIYRSEDAGATWRKMSGPMPHYALTELAVDPLNTNHLYVGTLGLGVLRAVLQAPAPATYTLSGVARYEGSATGQLVIGAFADAAFTTRVAMATLASPGNFSLGGLAAGTYYLLVFRDSNGNGERDENEPRYAGASAIDVRGDVSGVDALLSDPVVRPVILSATLTGQGVRVLATSVAGQSYALEFKDELGAPEWRRLAAVVAAGATIELIDPAGGTSPQRFYRVAQLRLGGGGGRVLDLGVTPSYEVAFNKEYDFGRLAADGIKRVNLYLTFKELEIGSRDPEHPEGLNIAGELDPIVDKLRALGMRASLIIELTNTDCEEGAPESCWLEYGITRELLYDASGKFVGFDHAVLAGRVEAVIKDMARRYAPEVITHLLVGNETDQYLRRHGHAADFKALLQRLRTALETIQPRPKLGTIFTFVPEADAPGFNALAREIAPAVEVIGFTIYPYLPAAVLEQRITPTADLTAKWFDSAQQAAAGRPLAVTETAHPGGGEFGSEADQADYARYVVEYLRQTAAPIEFVSWWCIEDSETHPFAGFRFTGLMTNNHAAKRAAYAIWAGGATPAP